MPRADAFGGRRDSDAFDDVPSSFSADQTGRYLTYRSYPISSCIPINTFNQSANNMSVEDENVITNVILPPDVWQLLFDELALRQDFSSLFSCACASKNLAGSGALANLYRYQLLFGSIKTEFANTSQCESQCTSQERRQ